MFTKDVCEVLSALRPRYFAAAPVVRPDDYTNMNSGVMLMNLRNLRDVDVDFRAFIEAHLNELVDQAWDQGAYRRYFGRVWPIARAMRASFISMGRSLRRRGCSAEEMRRTIRSR